MLAVQRCGAKLQAVDDFTVSARAGACDRALIREKGAECLLSRLHFFLLLSVLNFYVPSLSFTISSYL